MKLKFNTLEETPLPEHIKEKLMEAGFDTPEKVLAAEDSDLLRIAGIGRAMLRNIRIEVRTNLDRSLDPFRAVGEAYVKSFRTDYPKTSMVLNMQGRILTVGDFINLFEALTNEDTDGN